MGSERVDRQPAAVPTSTPAARPGRRPAVRLRFPRADPSTHAVDSSEVRRAIDAARGGPSRIAPSTVRAPIEAASGRDLGKVRLHDDAASWSLNGALGTAAFASGNDVYFRRGRLRPQTAAGRGLIAHELGHVAAPTGPPTSSRIQAAAIDTERVRVEAERKYRETADVLERRLGAHLSPMREVNEIADDMLARLRRIVDAWAEATKTGKEKVYEQEFVFPTGTKYYGSFLLTGKEIKKVFEKTNQPLRKKLNLIYYCARNGNFVKYLEVAAHELRLAAAGTTTTQQIKVGKGDKVQDVSVRSGFAAKSGLAATWKANAPAPKGKTSKEEVEADLDKRLGDAAKSGKAPVFGSGWTGALGMGDSNKQLRADKSYNAYAGLGLEDTQTLTRGDVPDITSAEMRLLYQREGRRQPKWITHKDKEKFKRDANTKILWEMGGENIEVAPASETRRIAEETKSRLEGGISGSTDLMMHASKHLGYTSVDDLKRIRLALLAWMLSNRDHSFFEIMRVAADYGPPFHLDKANPGAEYENPDHFHPLDASKVAAFSTLVPNGRMPSYYLSGAYLGTVDAALPSKGTSSSDFVDELTAAGLTLDASWKTDARAGDLAEWLALRTRCAGLALKTSRTEADLRFNRIAVQYLLKDSAWQHVVRSSVDVNARPNLRALLATQHGAGAVVTDAELTNIGVPPSLCATQDEYKRYDVYRLYLTVAAAAPGMGTASSAAHKGGVAALQASLPYRGVSAWLGRSLASLILSSMLDTTLGARATAAEKAGAATLPGYAAYLSAYPKPSDSAAHLVALGIPTSWVAWIDKTYEKKDPLLVHFRIHELALAAASAGFVAAESPTSPANAKARKRLANSDEHRRLALNLPDKHVPVIESYLVEKAAGARVLTAAAHQAAFEGKRTAEKLDELTALGVPRDVAEVAGKAALLAVHQLRRAVLDAPFDPAKSARRTVNKKAWSALRSSPAVTNLARERGFDELALPLAATMVRDLVSPQVLDDEATMLATATGQRIAVSDKQRLGGTQKIDTTTLTTPSFKDEGPAKDATEVAAREERYWASGASQRDFDANVGGKSPTVQAKLQAYRKKLNDDVAERSTAMTDIATTAVAQQPDPKDTVKAMEQRLFGGLSVTEQIDAIIGYLPPDELLTRLDPDTKAAIDAIAALSARERGALYQYTNKLHDHLGYATQQFATSDDFTVADLTATTDKLRSLKFMLPMVQALHSALERLPPYKGGNLYSGRNSGAKLTAKDDARRLAYAQRHFKVGSVISYSYPLSTAKDIASSFIPRPGTDVGLEILPPIISGRDIEYLSNKPNEKEVLFPQGARFQVVRFEAQPPGLVDDGTKNKLWVVLKEV